MKTFLRFRMLSKNSGGLFILETFVAYFSLKATTIQE